MAASEDSHPLLGYQCEFIDPVPEDFYCKSCNLVARKFTITSCCGETYCHACIAGTQEQRKPCPVCEEKDYSLTKQVKYQKKVKSLRIYCSMKERGCEWSGTLEQLDTHLDPYQGNCQYIDTKCLHCCKDIPKNMVDQHVAQHCIKRPYVCQHCNFKATYEEIVDKHLAECKYFPLQCPNMCGVTFERDFMEDHMKMCRLQEIMCSFCGVGCKDRFIREDQEEHSVHNNHKHLTLTATLAVTTKQQLLEQIISSKETEQHLKTKLKEQEQKFKELEKNLKVEYELLIDRKLQDQKDMLMKESNLQMKKLEERIEKLLKINSDQTKQQINFLMAHRFKLKNFTEEKDDSWIYSHDMYTHVNGYKFCVGVSIRRYTPRERCVAASVWAMPGEFDNQLEWPVKAKFTLELVHQYKGDNVIAEGCDLWSRPAYYVRVVNFNRSDDTSFQYFIKHSHLSPFLLKGALNFCISRIEFC